MQLKCRGVAPIEDIETGFEDGIKLAHLLSQLTGKEVKKINKKPQMTAVRGGVGGWWTTPKCHMYVVHSPPVQQRCL